MKTKYPRAVALVAARELVAAMRPATMPDRLICAGSLRRRKPEVGDVELVYVPRVVELDQREDLFGPKVKRDLAADAVADLVARGLLAPRHNVLGRTTWGAENKLALHAATGVPVDLFATTEAAFFNYLVCRTGPRELNEQIAATARALGWKWHPTGAGFENLHTGEYARMRSEREVFEFVGLPYGEPWERG